MFYLCRLRLLPILVTPVFLVVLLLFGRPVGVVDSDAMDIILIDPGHGGEDGGAVAADGTLEKHINLSIALSLRDLMTVCGYNATMTRESDVSVHDATAHSVREKKLSDLRNRLSQYDKASVVISIHQNQFSSSQYSGAQVFYSRGNRLMAEHIQHSIVTHLQPHNTRQVKETSDGIFLLYHTAKPAVLVECGFLSNAEECAALNTETYRQQLAMTVLHGYINSTIKGGGTDASQSKDSL